MSFRGVDYFLVDSLFSEEERMVRQTARRFADERILPHGTAYQTDVGMSGPYDSIIGVEKELVLRKFLSAMPGKFEAAKGNPKMCAALVTCDAATGRASAIQRIMLGE